MKAVPLPIAATTALEMIGPMPGIVIKCRQRSVFFQSASISPVTAAMRSSRRRQHIANPLVQSGADQLLQMVSDFGRDFVVKPPSRSSQFSGAQVCNEVGVEPPEE